MGLRLPRLSLMAPAAPVDFLGRGLWRPIAAPQPAPPAMASLVGQLPLQRLSLMAAAPPAGFLGRGLWQPIASHEAASPAMGPLAGPQPMQSQRL